MGYPTRQSDVFDRPALAARHWVITYRELSESGFSDEEIAHRVAIGVLHRIHRGVYAVGRPELTFEGRCLAAALACGPGSAVSYGPAGRVWGFRRWLGPIHVSGPRSLGGHPEVVVHRPRSLPSEDLAVHGGVPVTSVARTLLDLSPAQPVDLIARWMHEAGVQGVLDKQAVWVVLERHPHHRGGRRLEGALATEVVVTRTGLEDAFLTLSRRARMPRVFGNEELWSGVEYEEVDFYYPTLGLIVEVDGGRYHASRWRRRRDAAKDARFRAMGRTVWRVPELAITLDATGVLAQLRRLAATLGLSSSSDKRFG